MLPNANLWHRRDFWAKAVSMAYYLVKGLHTPQLISKTQKKSN